MRFREDNPENRDRARTAVRRWREDHPDGSRSAMSGIRSGLRLVPDELDQLTAGWHNQPEDSG